MNAYEMSRGWFWIVAVAALGCSETNGRQTSSTSHWLVCSVVDDCAEASEAVACTDGYCVDSAGERVVRNGTTNGVGGNTQQTSTGGLPTASGGTSGARTGGTGGTTTQANPSSGGDGGSGLDVGSGAEGGATAGGAASGGDGSTSAAGGAAGGASGGMTGGGSAAGQGSSANACGDELPPWPFACVDEEAFLVDGQDTGYVFCGNSVTHRVEQRECPILLEEAAPGACTTGACDSSADCDGDSICYEGASAGSCSCSTHCRTDADCDAGEICQCGTVIGVCVEAECVDDADCGDGQLCLLAGSGGFHCRTIGTIQDGVCPNECAGACGCDGYAYCNACEANLSGLLVTGDTECVAGAGDDGANCFVEADCLSGFSCCAGPANVSPRFCTEGACPKTP